MRRVSAACACACAALAAACVAACGGSSTSTSANRKASPPPVLPAGGEARPPAEAEPPLGVIEPPPRVRRPPLRPKIEAPPDGIIQLLAATREGDAALSIDERGGLRLWPTLDGKRPPVVVDLPRANSLVLAHRGSGFVAALRDDAGGLVIAQLDSDGRVLTRAAIAPEPRVTDVVAAEAGLLAWRADQTIALYGDDGSTRARLAADPGQRIAALGVIPGGALAILAVTSESGGLTTAARQLLATPRSLAWGGARDLAAETDGTFAISPQGHYIAHVGTTTRDLAVIELATARIVVTAKVASNAAVGFSDEAHAVVAAPSNTVWLALDGTAAVTVKLDPHVFRRGGAGTAFAIGRGMVISANFGELVLATTQDTHYLGYGLAVARFLEPDGNGGVLAGVTGDAGTELALADRELKLTRKLASAVPTLDAYARVTDTDWVVATLPAAGEKDRSVRLSVLAAATDDLQQKPPLVERMSRMAAEPSTHLVGLTGLLQVSLLQFDPKLRSLTPVTQMGMRARTTTVLPVDPKLASGTRVLRLVDDSGTTVLEWLHDETRPPTKRVSVTGEVLGTDRAGHVYVNESGTPAIVAVFAEGERVGQLTLPPEAISRQLWPNPSGTLVAVRTKTGLAEYQVSDGAQRWAARLPTFQRVVWLGEDSLLLVGDGGLARLDPATGAFAATTCGWDFRLGTTPLPIGVRREPWCALSTSE